MILRALRYLWALPNTLFGLCFLPLTFGRGGRVQRREGVLELSSPAIARLLRKGSLLRGGIRAITLGHVVLGRDAATLDRCRRHEQVHVRQYERWGPLFVPAYLAASLFAYARGLDPYRDNRFEREAFACERTDRDGTAQEEGSMRT